MSCFSSCDKVDIQFSDDRIEEDPNVTLFENYEVGLSTYKMDSFITSGHDIFTIGHHVDPSFGSIDAGSFAEIQLPPENTLKSQDVTFDSLVIILRPNGNFYGDTLQAFQVSAHRVLQKIENEDDVNGNFYNPRKLQFDQAPLGQSTTTLRPRKATEIKVRLSNALGQDLVMKLKANNDTIQNQDLFIKYLNGIYLRSDSNVSNALYYFRTDSAGFMRLHYTLRGPEPQKKYIDFGFNSSKQFNNIQYSLGGTLSVFTPFKKQLKPSSQTGNKAFLNSNMGMFIKINFPSLLGLKETHPYIKILKAELIIKPVQASGKYPYQLSDSLILHVTDDGNGLGSLLMDATGQVMQVGNLIVDNLYGEKTYYSYDLTSFINAVLDEGSFSKLALMVTASSSTSDSDIDRLVINDNTLNQNVQLKLYVLGL